MEIADVMCPLQATVGPDDTVRTAATRMAECGHQALPVLDAEQRLVGLVSELGLLRLLLPSYLADAEELGYLPPELLSDASALAALTALPLSRAIQLSPVPTVATDESVLEAIRIMSQHCLQHLPVTQGNEVVGMVHCSQLVRQIILLPPED